ncbi:MAG: ATP-binding cassette domain-containing protein, partial [Armatimonadota bacterium]|nr:ATP-binding cassette domain-containing protein [Armatimonadota bacterium]
SALVNSINQRILMDLQERMFAHLQRLPHSFYAKAKIGDIMARVAGDLQVVQGAMSQVPNTAIFQVLTLAINSATVIYLTRKAPGLGLVILAMVPLFGFGFLLLRSGIQQASREQQKRVGASMAAVQENLSAYAVVRAFGLERMAAESYHRRLQDQLQTWNRMATLNTRADLSVSMMMALAQLVVLIYGGLCFLDGRLTVGDLPALFMLTAQVFGPVVQLAGVGQTMQTASGALDRVNELFDEPITINDKPDAVVLQPLTTEIRFEQVAFGYGGGRSILQDLNLVIPAGANVAIVGPTGCGKSTTINLLLRFWDPEKGRVLVDGQDLRDVTLSSLRSQIGLVFQDTFIFDDTVRRNIAIGKPDASDEEIAAAAHAARLDNFIAGLPAGYDTPLGERGVRMSGGERQRLALARVVLRNPRILVLDEATSALDAKTEMEILETLSQLAKGRTTISITHRLSWAAMADEIVVLDQGHVVEQGPHAELVHAGGLYQQLYEEQTGHLTEATPRRAGLEADRLRAVPLFANVKGAGLALLADKLMLERFAAGEDIVRQGDPGDKLYVIGQGQADVLGADETGERRINILHDGDYFGEIALLADTPRTATVRTTMPTQLYSLSRTDFLSLLEREPVIRETISTTVAKRRAVFDGAGSAAQTKAAAGSTG